jgi:polyadenylation factor subunit 2
VWDFGRCVVDTRLTGHGGDVKAVDWHPRQALLASGSKDGLVKLWDPKARGALTSFHGNKGIITAAKWNQNGNWLLTACRDQLCKVCAPNFHTIIYLELFLNHTHFVYNHFH